MHTGGLRIEPDIARLLVDKLGEAAQLLAFGLVLHVQSNTEGCGAFKSSELVTT